MLEMTWNMEDTFDKMAKLKIKMKKLEKQYKDLEINAINKSFQKYKHKLGTFHPVTRENYTMDNCAVAKEIGLKLYKQYSSISKTGIEKAVGSKGFEKLLKNEAVMQNDSSYYYMFKS